MINPQNLSLCDRIIACIAVADRDGAVSHIRKEGEENGYASLVERVLIPVLARFSDQFVNLDESPLARGYVAAKVAEETMALVAEKTLSPDPIAPTKGPVILGNIEDDFHALGRRIVHTFLRSHSWEVIDLECDVLAEDFVETAIAHRARVIGVSAMMATTAANILQVRQELDRRGLTGRIRLAVGGAIFNLRPELVQEVGGDGSARSAVEAPALFERLTRAAIESGDLP